MQSRLPSAYYPSTLASSGNGYSCFVNCLFSLVIGADLPCSVNSHFKEEFPCNFFFVFISYTKPLMQLALFCTWYEAKANFMFLAMMQTLASMSLFCISCFYSMTYFLFLLCLFVWIWFFWDRVSLYSPGCSGTQSVDQAGLELRNPPASASQSAGITGMHHHHLAIFYIPVSCLYTTL